MLFAVASQCLESAYGVTIRDVDAATLYPLPGSLQEIFSSGISHLVSICHFFFCNSQNRVFSFNHNTSLNFNCCHS